MHGSPEHVTSGTPSGHSVRQEGERENVCVCEFNDPCKALVIEN